MTILNAFSNVTFHAVCNIGICECKMSATFKKKNVFIANTKFCSETLVGAVFEKLGDV